LFKRATGMLGVLAKHPEMSSVESLCFKADSGG